MENLLPLPDPKTVSPRPIATRYGLIAALILVLVGLGMYLGGFVDMTNRGSAANWISNIINFGVMIGASIMAVRKHRDEDLGGFISFGRVFKTSFLVILIITIISAVWSYVFFSFVAPDLIDTIIEASRTQMAEKQGLSEEQIDQSMAMVGWMFSPVSLSLMAGISMLFFGLIISLILGGFMKRDAPQTLES